MSVTLIIRETPAEPGDSDLIARIDEYAGPVPAAGQYIRIPSRAEFPGVRKLPYDGNVKSVKCVTLAILARPVTGGEPEWGGYVDREDYVIEVHV